MSDLRAAVQHQPSTRLIGAPGAVGLALSLILFSTLLYLLWRDHEGKLHESEQRVADIALGTDRVLSLQMLNLDRGLRTLAGELDDAGRAAGGNFPAPLQQSIDGIVWRHGELIDMVIVDGVRRIIAYRALQSYPLVVVVCVSRADILRPWYRTACCCRLTILAPATRACPTCTGCRSTS